MQSIENSLILQFAVFLIWLKTTIILLKCYVQFWGAVCVVEINKLYKINDGTYTLGYSLSLSKKLISFNQLWCHIKRIYVSNITSSFRPWRFYQISLMNRRSFYKKADYYNYLNIQYYEDDVPPAVAGTTIAFPLYIIFDEFNISL